VVREAAGVAVRAATEAAVATTAAEAAAMAAATEEVAATTEAVAAGAHPSSEIPRYQDSDNRYPFTSFVSLLSRSPIRSATTALIVAW
jgi:hypothetical protein